MQGVVVAIILCVICFLTGLGIGTFYSKKIRREIWEKLEVVDKKIDDIQKKIR